PNVSTSIMRCARPAVSTQPAQLSRPVVQDERGSCVHRLASVAGAELTAIGRSLIAQRLSGSALLRRLTRMDESVADKTNKPFEPSEPCGRRRHEQPLRPLQPKARLTRAVIEFDPRHVVH